MSTSNWEESTLTRSMASAVGFANQIGPCLQLRVTDEGQIIHFPIDLNNADLFSDKAVTLRLVSAF